MVFSFCGVARLDWIGATTGVAMSAAFERMALGDEDLSVDGAVAGLAGLMADEQMPEEVWLAVGAGELSRLRPAVG
jgi:hypothetical protein